jgi:hypothetical protein
MLEVQLVADINDRVMLSSLYQGKIDFISSSGVRIMYGDCKSIFVSWENLNLDSSGNLFVDGEYLKDRSDFDNRGL